MQEGDDDLQITYRGEGDLVLKKSTATEKNGKKDQIKRWQRKSESLRS